MKHFFSSYGFTVFALLIVSALLVTISPIGKQVGDGINENTNTFSIAARTSIEGVGVPSTLGYKPKDIVEIGGKNHVILQDKGSNRYLVMNINEIGKKKFNYDNNGQNPDKCGMIDGVWSNETCNNQYENSDIDEYLNGEYYNSLPSDVKQSIVDTNIYQSYYQYDQINPNYKFIEKGNPNFDGCHNTACVLEPNGKWISWEEHQPIRNQIGMHTLKMVNNESNFKTIKRKVFLPSVNEVSSIVNFNDQWEMDKFLKVEGGNRLHMWFRDVRLDPNHKTNIAIGNYAARSLGFTNVIADNIYTRPAFVIDLETYQRLQTN